MKYVQKRNVMDCQQITLVNNQPAFGLLAWMKKNNIEHEKVKGGHKFKTPLYCIFAYPSQWLTVNENHRLYAFSDKEFKARFMLLTN